MNNHEALYESYMLRGVNAERLQAILSFAGQSILDIGCGSGAYVLELADKYNIYGADYQQFPTWNQKPECFYLAEASDLSMFEDKSFDTIVCFETLEHLESPDIVLGEFYRIASKNIIITVPNCKNTIGMLASELIYKPYIDRTHIQFFTLETIESMVIEAGFHINQKSYINEISLLPLLKEAFDLNDDLGNEIIKLLYSRRSTQRYHITCLIVADKSK